MIAILRRDMLRRARKAEHRGSELRRAMHR